MPEQSMRQPLPREPMFVRLHDKAVHVVDNATTAAYAEAWKVPSDPALAAVPEAVDLVDPIAWALGTITTRCGRRIDRNVGGLDASGSLVSAFDDLDLCAACHATVRPEEQHHLFEHDQGSLAP